MDLSFALGVVVAARFGGRGPGLVAGALSAVIVNWLFVKQFHSLAITDETAQWEIGLFLVLALPIALLVGSLRESLLARASAAEELRHQAQLIDLSHDAVITMDSQLRILTWNKGAEEIYGWSKHDAIGKVFPQLLQTAGPHSLAEIDTALRQEGRWEGELSQKAHNGHRLNVDSRHVLFGGGNGLPPCILAISRNITQRKPAEEALRASEARLEFVLEAGKLGAWDLDLINHTAWRSPQHDAIFGYPSLLPKWTYEMFLDHVLPEDRKTVDEEVQRSASSGANLQFECRIRRNDGIMRWIWAQGRCKLDKDGRPVRLSGIVRDVTARKKMEEDLRESMDQFRTLANAIPQLSGMANPDGRFFWSNKRWYDYTGLTPEQSEGWGWVSALDPEASSAALEGWRRSIAAGEPFESVMAVRGADAVVRPFLALAMPVCDRYGKVVRWFATMTDISEQRRTEIALRKAHSEELARATELQAIMDAMPISMFISRDAACRHVFGNHSAYELLRLPPGGNLSKSAPTDDRLATYRVMKEGSEIPPQELPLQKAAATGQPVYNLELELAFEDGSRADIIGNAVPILDAQGRSRGAVGIFVDITERKQNEERLRQTQRLESIGILAGGVAHDFNNLLTVIIGNAESALRYHPSSVEIQHIMSASERAAQLTRQLLAYAGKGQFVAKTFDLRDLVSNSAQLLAATIPKKVELVLQLSEEELPVKADPTQIEQILMNLVINAGEAIPPQIAGRIEIAIGTCEVVGERVREHTPEFDARPGRFVCLDVTDNGSGMDKTTLKRIFDPFFSTKFTGRGLGLAAVQGIVRSCRGFIEVHSSMGVGSTFRVFLPAAEKAAVEVLADSQPHASGRRDRRRAAILVADDEEIVRQMACTALRSCGYEVLEAANGRDALAVLAGAAPSPSLVLLDLTMPVMGGEELVPILNQDYPGVQIIVTSGYAEEDAHRRFPPGAAVGFLQKPYTEAALIEKVEEILKRGSNRIRQTT
jgi:PAS domain S-box-containing protein